MKLRNKDCIDISEGNCRTLNLMIFLLSNCYQADVLLSQNIPKVNDIRSSKLPKLLIFQISNYYQGDVVPSFKFSHRTWCPLSQKLANLTIIHSNKKFQQKHAKLISEAILCHFSKLSQVYAVLLIFYFQCMSSFNTISTLRCTYKIISKATLYRLSKHSKLML